MRKSRGFFVAPSPPFATPDSAFRKQVFGWGFQVTLTKYRRYCKKKRQRVAQACRQFRRGRRAQTEVLEIIRRVRAELVRVNCAYRPTHLADTRQLLVYLDSLGATYLTEDLSSLAPRRAPRRAATAGRRAAEWVEGFSDASVSPTASGLGGYLQCGRHRLHQFSVARPPMTSHATEQAALDQLLADALALSVRRLRVHTDSLSCTLIPRHWYARFEVLEVCWIPREFNQRADALARAAAFPLGLPRPDQLGRRRPAPEPVPSIVRFPLTGVLSGPAVPCARCRATGGAASVQAALFASACQL